MEVSLPIQAKQEPLHLVVDATGLKVYGEGEWKVRQHGWSKHRTWRKVHLGVDEATGELLAVAVSTPLQHEKDVLSDLLEQVDHLVHLHRSSCATLIPCDSSRGYTACGGNVGLRRRHTSNAPSLDNNSCGDALEVSLQQVSGDGGYDFMTCYRDIAQRGAWATIPPRRNACPCPRGETPQRDANLRRIQELQEVAEVAEHSQSKKRQEWARQRWKEESGYHRRSLAETAVFRLKSIFGEKLSSRGGQAQDSEVFLRCAALNRMTHLGMPESYAI